MRRFLTQRLVALLPTLLGISVIVFVVIHLIPGDTISAMIGTQYKLTEAQAVALRAYYGLDKPLVEQYFVAKEQGTFTAGEKLRSLVHFQQLDLIHDTPLKHVDIVFCRYVFIYMSRELQESALRAFHGALNRNRFLILGRTESMPVHLLDRLFASVNPEERVYRKLTEGS